MKPEDLAERHAFDRNGFDLVDYGEIGLPFWRIRVRCDALSPKSISAFQEMLLRGLNIGITDPAELGTLLGLDDRLLDASMASLVGEEWVKSDSSGAYRLTESGTGVLAAAAEIVPVERVAPLDFDGLLREVTIFEGALTPKQLTDSGAREVPPYPARKPDLPELRSHSAAIQKMLRTAAHGRDQETHLVGIKQIDRRDRMFQRALALVYRARTGNQVQVGIVVDDELSPRHEEAFARAELVERLGLDRSLRRRKSSAIPDEIPTELVERLDIPAEESAREKIRAAQLENDALGGSSPPHATENSLETARTELTRLSVRTVPTYEHPRLLELALRSSSRRLLLVSPWVKDAIIDQAFVRKLTERLKAGADVRLGYGISEDPEEDIDRKAHDRLRSLANDFKNFNFAHLGGGVHAKVLLSDSSFLVVTSFNWMSFRGDPSRRFRDERGVVLTTASDIDAEWDDWLSTWPNSQHKAAPNSHPESHIQRTRKPRPRRS